MISKKLKCGPILLHNGNKKEIVVEYEYISFKRDQCDTFGQKTSLHSRLQYPGGSPRRSMMCLKPSEHIAEQQPSANGSTDLLIFLNSDLPQTTNNDELQHVVVQ